MLEHYGTLCAAQAAWLLNLLRRALVQQHMVWRMMRQHTAVVRGPFIAHTCFEFLHSVASDFLSTMSWCTSRFRCCRHEVDGELYIIPG